MQTLYSSVDAARLGGITDRQLDYWYRTGLVECATRSPRDAYSSGWYRKYTTATIGQLRVFKALLDAGYTVETLRGLRVPEFNDRGVVEEYVLAVYGGVAEYVEVTEILEFIRRAGTIVAVLPAAQI